MNYNHFIKEIEIKKYKLFKNFKIEGLGRINLISGKNNIGKTAFMEALFINTYSTDISSMTHALYSPKFAREFLETEYRTLSTNDKKKECLEAIKEYSSISNINNTEFKIIESNGIKEYLFHCNNKNIKVNINDFSYEISRKNNIKFLTQLGFTKYQLNEVFEAVQKKDKEDDLNQYIHSFDKNIKKFKIIGGNKPQCKTKDGLYRDINDFGNGLKHYISTICLLYACENGYLFIDEIDNGIHYTQLKRLWEIIFTISKEQNVQVFATTHSKECIESFNKIQKKLQDNESYYFEMYKNVKKDKIEMRQLDNEQLEYELTHKGRFRGE